MSAEDNKESDIEPGSQKTEEIVISKENLEAIEKFRLMDDDFMRLVLEGDREAVAEIIRIILDKDDIVVLNVTAQREYISTFAGGRTIRMDIQAVDSKDIHYDIEIQRDDRGAAPERARYHSSALDSKMLKAKQKFTELRESYVIFITENAIYKANLPLYHIDRQIQELGCPFNDGAHIIFVNGTYNNNENPVGRLMHDFRCSNPDDIFSPVLAKKVRYFKMEEGGRAAVCKMMEEMCQKSKTDGENNILTLMQKLFAAGRDDDAKKASNDRAYCAELMTEFGLAK